MPEYTVGKKGKHGAYATAGSFEIAEALEQAYADEYGEHLGVYDMAGRRADAPRRRR